MALDGAEGDFVKWSDNYLTGIKRIDDQHKALFQMSDAFRDALSEGSGQRVYGSLLGSLRAYARAHFGFEEGCMERCQCSAAERNIHAHSQFLQGLTGDFEKRYAIVGFESADDAPAWSSFSTTGWLITFVPSTYNSSHTRRAYKFTSCWLSPGIAPIVPLDPRSSPA